MQVRSVFLVRGLIAFGYQSLVIPGHINQGLVRNSDSEILTQNVTVGI